ncbi:MAG: tetratricopeptide repeat protein [Spirochaetota bacterium]
MNDRVKISTLVLLSLVTLYSATQERQDALELYRKGKYEEAIAVCLQELEVMPRRMDAYVVLGWSLLRLERYQEAFDNAAKGYQTAPNDHRLIEILGESNFYLGKHQEALKYLEEYAVLAPTGDRIETVYYLMGEIYIQLGEYNHADIALSTALYYSPNVARWWARLGYAREMAKDYQWALDAYNKALNLNSSLTDAIRGKERAQQKLGSG